MSDFLDKDYEVPQKTGNYMRFKDGKNRFRVLGSAITGWEGWKTQDDGSLKPVRVPMDGKIPMDSVDDEERVKHFWAFPVWNYQEEKIQILEITQKGVQKAIRALTKDEEWGDPKTYDIVVTRSGERLETEYQVNPIPPKPLDKEIEQLFKDTPINLNALYSGDDPFAGEEVNIDEVDKDLNN